MKISGFCSSTFTKRQLLLPLVRFKKAAEFPKDKDVLYRRYKIVTCKSEQEVSKSEEEKLAKKREEVERLKAAEKYILFSLYCYLTHLASKVYTKR